MKRLAIVLALLTLPGCANIKFQWSASYATDNLAAELERAKAEK